MGYSTELQINCIVLYFDSVRPLMSVSWCFWCRLRDALQRIKNEDITKEEVAEILQLTIHVLEANVPEEHRFHSS